MNLTCLIFCLFNRLIKRQKNYTVSGPYAAVLRMLVFMLCFMFSSSASDKEKLFPENLSKNSNLDDSSISLTVFPSRTNLKLHNISVTPKTIKKVIMNLDLLKASRPDCIRTLQ